MRHTLSHASIHLHGVALAVAGWLVFGWAQAVPGGFDRFGTLRGVDFLQFYAAGWTVAHGQAGTLYNWDAFTRALPTLVPGIGGLLFLPVYPPQVALAFAPLAMLSYLPALAIWTVVSAALYLVAAHVVIRRLPLGRYRVEAWWLAAGFPPFLQLVAHGQITALALAVLVAAWLAFRSGRVWLVGLALGSLVFKPQLGAFALVALLLWPSWRLLAGLALGAGAQMGLVALTLGPALLQDYLAVLGRLAGSAEQFEPKLWAMHGLRGAVVLVLGSSRVATIVWLVGCVGVIWWARRAWMRQSAPDVRFSLVCLTGLVLNPHLYIYDLVLLALPLACLAGWLIERRGAGDRPVQYLTYGLVWLPLLGPLAAYTHLQLTSPALISLIWHLGRYRLATTQDSSV